MSVYKEVPEVAFHHPADTELGFEVVPLETIRQRRYLDHQPETPHRVMFFTIIFIESGVGKHNIDSQDFPFQPGTFLFVYPNQVHTWDFSGKPKGKAIVFTESFVEQLATKIRLPFNHTSLNINGINLQTIHSKKIDWLFFIRLLDLIILEQESTVPNKEIVMHLYSVLYLMLDRISPHRIKNGLSPRKNTLFHEFTTLLHKQYKVVRDASWYAHRLNTTYKTLNMRAKEATNLTLKQLINEYVIAELKRELVLGKSTVQQLALEFGFEDVSNFNKYFKNLTYSTPNQFKQKTKR